MRKIWTKEEEEILKKEYPNVCGKILSKKFNCKHEALLGKAHRMGLKKDISFLRDAGKRLIECGKDFRFEKGMTPHNKGKKLEEFMSSKDIEEMKKNQFKKGMTPHNALPIGSEVLRPDKSGRIYIKIKVEGKRQLVYKHIHLWEQHNNKKLPKGHNVVFKDGDTMNFNINNLEAISDAELMRRNTINQYPKELRQAIKLNNKIKNYGKQK